MMEEASSGRSTSRFMVSCLWMRLVLLQIQSLKPRGKQTWKKMLAWAVAVVFRVDDAPAPRGYMPAMMVDKPDMIFYKRDFMKQYHDAPNKHFFS